MMNDVYSVVYKVLLVINLESNITFLLLMAWVFVHRNQKMINLEKNIIALPKKHLQLRPFMIDHLTISFSICTLTC